MSAPERIFCKEGHDAWNAWGHWYLHSKGGGTEYVRADLCAPTDERVMALEAENARLRETLRTIVSRCDDAKRLCSDGHPVSAYNVASGILGQIGSDAVALRDMEGFGK